MRPHPTALSLLRNVWMGSVSAGARFKPSGAMTLLPWTPYPLVAISGRATPAWALACYGTWRHRQLSRRGDDPS
jgi:hypothetical protein